MSISESASASPSPWQKPQWREVWKPRLRETLLRISLKPELENYQSAHFNDLLEALSQVPKVQSWEESGAETYRLILSERAGEFFKFLKKHVNLARALERRPLSLFKQILNNLLKLEIDPESPEADKEKALAPEERTYTERILRGEIGAQELAQELVLLIENALTNDHAVHFTLTDLFIGDPEQKDLPGGAIAYTLRQIFDIKLEPESKPKSYEIDLYGSIDNPEEPNFGPSWDER